MVKQQCWGYNLKDNTKYNYNKRCHHLTENRFCEEHHDCLGLINNESKFIKFMTNITDVSKLKTNKIYYVTETFTFLNESNTVICKHKPFCEVIIKKTQDLLLDHNVLKCPNLVEILTNVKIKSENIYATVHKE